MTARHLDVADEVAAHDAVGEIVATAGRLDILINNNAEIAAPGGARTPPGRLATTNDVAVAILFLASDAAAMVTGQLVIDGGWLAQ